MLCFGLSCTSGRLLSVQEVTSLKIRFCTFYDLYFSFNTAHKYTAGRPNSIHSRTCTHTCTCTCTCTGKQCLSNQQHHFLQLPLLFTIRRSNQTRHRQRQRRRGKENNQRKALRLLSHNLSVPTESTESSENDNR